MSEMLQAAGLDAAAQLAGGIIQGASNKKEGKRAWRRTKVLNQNQIQWRVKDAQAAGVSPLVALGMNPAGQVMPNTGSAMGDALANAGGAIAQGIRGHADAKRQALADQLAAAESKARTAEYVTAADRNRAEAEYTDQMRANSITALFRSPGRAGYSGNEAEAKSEAYAPVGGGAPHFDTAIGDIKLDPKYTPAEHMENLRGDFIPEVYNVINHLAELYTQGSGKRLASKAAANHPLAHYARYAQELLKYVYGGVGDYVRRPRNSKVMP